MCEGCIARAMCPYACFFFFCPPSLFVQIELEVNGELFLLQEIQIVVVQLQGRGKRACVFPDKKHGIY